jgi:hypothetical protein
LCHGVVEWGDHTTVVISAAIAVEHLCWSCSTFGLLKYPKLSKIDPEYGRVGSTLYTGAMQKMGQADSKASVKRIG